MLLDARMPGVDGLALAEQVRQRPELSLETLRNQAARADERGRIDDR
jgi:CheY-like chemotaxis protein